MSFLGFNFGQNADVDIILDGQDERKMAEIKDENGRKERHYLFYDGESVNGKVNITLHRKTNRLEHQGIRIEFIGQIELYYDRGNHHEFLSLVKQLAGPGELHQNTSFEFEFNQVEKPFECYTGANVRLRYFLRVTVVRRLTDLTKEMDLLVHTLATYPEMNNPIKMEVGIEECLHIEFEYNKSKYHLKDVIVGKIYFLLVRIKIKHMEVAIIKRETTGSGPNTFHDNETIAKYEIMDGAPVRGESIPIRVFLAGYDLTPTMRDINKKFSVKYYLNLVLVDEEERRYFKQQEITLWRKGERVRKGVPQSNSVYQVPHAMARHVAGDHPSQNIRTAPTPSEPNTPISVPSSGIGNQEIQPGMLPSSSKPDAMERSESPASSQESSQPSHQRNEEHNAEQEREGNDFEKSNIVNSDVPSQNEKIMEIDVKNNSTESVEKMTEEKMLSETEQVKEEKTESDSANNPSPPPANSVVKDGDEDREISDPKSPVRLVESPPPMDDLTLDDDVDIGDNNDVQDLSDLDDEGFEQVDQQTVGSKKKKAAEPIPS